MEQNMEARMDFGAVRAALKRYKIHTGSDRGKELRAAFYLHKIEDVQAQLQAKLNDELSGDDKVSVAINSLSWAQGLFEAFDLWIRPIINNHFKLSSAGDEYWAALYNAMYRSIWSTDPEVFKNNVEAFYQ